MRLLAFAIVAALAYAAGRAREYRAWMTACETPTPQAETYDEVQPRDTLTSMLLADSVRDQRLVAEWDATLPDLAPLTAADRDWLDQTVRSHLHPAT